MDSLGGSHTRIAFTRWSHTDDLDDVIATGVADHERFRALVTDVEPLSTIVRSNVDAGATQRLVAALLGALADAD